MKGILLSLTLVMMGAQANSIEVNWNYFANNGDFIMSSDFTHLQSGTLPPDGKQSVQGCSVKVLSVKNGFAITCNNKTWTFTSNGRFSCVIGGWGMWTAPSEERGSYACN